MKSRPQSKPTIDDAWPPPRCDWFPGYTAHRDGWVRSLNGRTLFCGGRKSTREQVERRFESLRDARDDAGDAPRDPRTYRELLAEFLAACEHRVATGQPRPLSPRTLHNYVAVLNDFGNFVGGGTMIEEANRPAVFADYAKRFSGWKASGFDSVVTRVGAMFQWAARMEYIDRYRPGPMFQRPDKSRIRHDRVQLKLCFSPAEFRQLIEAANPTMRCFLRLGLFCAMNNSEVSHLAREVIDLEAARIDFRRRKQGSIRRICPMPAELIADLRHYIRPDPADPRDSGLMFLTRRGHAYSSTRHRDGKPSDMIGRLFTRLMSKAGVEQRRLRGFKGLRTTFYNACPRGFELERAIIMGRAQGSVDYDSYLEGEGSARLSELVDHVSSQFST